MVCRLALVAAVLVLSAPLRAEWWNHDWPYRRPIALDDYEPSGLPGDDIAVVTMPTAGLAAADGRDIRVASKGGRLVPHRVLMTGPGDLVTVAFALRGAGPDYFVYFGNPDAEAPDEDLEIQRGVLQETWRYPGGAMRTLAEVQAVLDSADTLIGRGFRDGIFQGHNPFGPEDDLAGVFTAYFIAPQDGRYTFCISSQNASFLVIDGQLAVANGGRHPPQANVAMQGDVELQAGLHRARFYHVSPSGDPVVVLAWQPPGGERIWPMMPAAFAPVARAEPRALQEYGQSVTVDFIPVHAGESFMADRYFQRYGFEAISTGSPGRDARWQWDFGDGSTAAGLAAEHIYLVPGEYTVTLTAQTLAGRQTRTNRIVVARPWELVTQTRLDSLGDYADIVSQYDFTTLRADVLAEAMDLLRRAENNEALAAAGEAFLARETAPPKAVVAALSIYSDLLRSRDEAERAARALLRGVEMVADAQAQAALFVQAGRIRLDDLAQADEAMHLFEQALGKVGRSARGAIAQQAHMGAGDVHRLRGDLQAAAEAYELARPQRRELPEQDQFSAGDLARHVEAYSLARDYASAQSYLDRWATELPAAKLTGYWSLLQVKLHMLQGDDLAAAEEAEILVGVNPASNYGAELLMLAANAYHRAGQGDKVVETLEAIVELYPESTYAVEASEALDSR